MSRDDHLLLTGPVVPDPGRRAPYGTNLFEPDFRAANNYPKLFRTSSRNELAESYLTRTVRKPWCDDLSTTVQILELETRTHSSTQPERAHTSQGLRLYRASM